MDDSDVHSEAEEPSEQKAAPDAYHYTRDPPGYTAYESHEKASRGYEMGDYR